MKSSLIPLINHHAISLEKEERKENLILNNLLKLNLRKLKKELRGKRKEIIAISQYNCIAIK